MDLPEQIVYDFCHFLYDVYGKYEKVCIIAYKVRKENAWQTKIGLNQRGNFEVLIKKSNREKWTFITWCYCTSEDSWFEDFGSLWYLWIIFKVPFWSTGIVTNRSGISWKNFGKICYLIDRIKKQTFIL